MTPPPSPHTRAPSPHAHTAPRHAHAPLTTRTPRALLTARDRDGRCPELAVCTIEKGNGLVSARARTRDVRRHAYTRARTHTHEENLHLGGERDIDSIETPRAPSQRVN